MVAVKRCIFLFILTAAGVSLAQAPPPAPASSPVPPPGAGPSPTQPSRLIIDPNGILRPSDPLLITLEGVPQGTAVRLRLLQDCNSDGSPEESSQGQCVNPLYDRPSAQAGDKNIVEDRLDFAALAAAGQLPPSGRALWLRIGEPEAVPLLQARFAIDADPCSFFATAFQTFTRGECGLRVPQVLRQHRGLSGMQYASFEVRYVTVGEAKNEPKSVPGTRGATGVAWKDGQTLLFTAARDADGEGPAAGLFQATLGQETPQPLWTTEGDRVAVAPFSLGAGRYAFVEQTPGPQRPGAAAEVAWLLILSGGEIEERVPLPYKVHQLLAVNAKGTGLLALSLGVADNHPTLLKIDLKGAATDPESSNVEVLGFDNSLYAAALREPGGKRSAVAFENTYLTRGWQVMWIDSEGRSHDLVKRRDHHDLLPAWRPCGGEVAYLAEMETL